LEPETVNRRKRQKDKQ